MQEHKGSWLALKAELLRKLFKLLGDTVTLREPLG